MFRRIVVTFGALFLVACGGSASGATATVTTASPIDSCLIGTWTSTGITGSSVVNGMTVVAGGGAGQVVKFTRTGTMSVDDSQMKPVTLTSNGTQQATEKLTGSSAGAVTRIKGRLDYKPTPGGTESFTLFAPSGMPIGTPTVDTGLDTAYTCTPGASFSLSEGSGLSLVYAPG
jgi:hypothetical protein